MTAYTYAELTTPTTKAERLAALLALAADEELPLTAWDSGSFPRVMFEIDAAAEEDFAQLIAAIARGGILEDASGKWLTILAKSFYEIERKQATSTQGQFILTCASNAGPYTIQAGKYWAASGSKLFFNTEGGTLAAGSPLTLQWQAKEAGAGYRIDDNSNLRLLTPLAGVAVTNPARGSSPWYTRAGTIEETDSQLRRRCRDKWPALGTGATADAYHLWALSVTDAVTRATVLPAYPSGGHVTVVIAGGAAVEASVTDSVAAHIVTVRPLCVTTHVSSATNRTINIAGTAVVKAGGASSLQGKVEDAIDAFLQTCDIGDTIYVSALVEVIMAIDGMVDVKLTSPTADIVCTSTEVPVLGTVSIPNPTEVS